MTYEAEDNPQNIPLSNILKGFVLLTSQQKKKLRELNLGVKRLNFIRMSVTNHLTQEHSSWHIGCSGTSDDITYIIDERFQFDKFYEDMKKKKGRIFL